MVVCKGTEKWQDFFAETVWYEYTIMLTRQKAFFKVEKQKGR